MASLIDFSAGLGGRTIIRTASKGQRVALAITTGRQRLASDSLGTFSLVLKQVVAGSRYRVELLVGGAAATPSTNAEGIVPGTPGTLVDHTITLNYYAGGSANNDLRIKVRKASEAPYYRAFESQATARAGTVEVFVSQQLDE